MAEAVKEFKAIYTDIIANNNKFWYGYCLADGSGYSEWGRVGLTATRTNFPSHHIVEKKYNEKLRKGYEPLKVIKTGEVKTTQVSNLKEVAKKQIKLSDPLLVKLVDELVSINIHNITSNTTIKYDVDSGLFSTPLGLVEKEGIDEARNLLLEINDLVKKEDYKTVKAQKAFNKYLKIIPQDLGMKLDIRNLFPDSDAIKKQSDILDSLEVSLKSTLSPKAEKTQITEEQIFNVEIGYLPPTDPEYLRICKYYNGTNRAVHGYTQIKVNNIFKVALQSNLDKYKPLSNVVEVFHGTSGANCLSILKSGLRAIPPSTAAVCGAMFGPGVYGATDSSKSLQYTAGRFGGKNTGKCYMFLCDFAMGKHYEPHTYGSVHRPAGYDSIWAKAKNTGLRFDELIVPDNQVKIKYLIELK
jgi:poly [ADP-ribose] polymerase 2/3/4